jgi:hypothetical protein
VTGDAELLALYRQAQADVAAALAAVHRGETEQDHRCAPTSTLRGRAGQVIVLCQDRHVICTVSGPEWAGSLMEARLGEAAARRHRAAKPAEQIKAHPQPRRGRQEEVLF